MCRSRRELSNAYLLALFGFDTAENEACKVCRIPRRTSHAPDISEVVAVEDDGVRVVQRPVPRSPTARSSLHSFSLLPHLAEPQGPAGVKRFAPALMRNARWPNGSVGRTWQGSFSAVSRPNFARKYALESSRRDLHNALLCTFLKMLKVLFKIADWFANFFAKF